MLAFYKEIVHNVFRMDEVKEIGKETVSIIAISDETHW